MTTGPERHILLSGVVGSTAYGLAHEGSDVDRLAVFAAPTRDFLGLRRAEESVVTTKPDVTMHEAVKFCRLALKCNPTVTELMWLGGYETLTPLGEELIPIRTAFLSASYVRNAYFGYAVQQFEKLQSREDGTFGPDLAKRTEKHARHMYRLLIQGLELWRTGVLDVTIHHPDLVWSFGERIAQGDVEHASTLLGSYEEMFDSISTVLPDMPDAELVEAWLQKVRAEYYVPGDVG